MLPEAAAPLASPVSAAAAQMHCLVRGHTVQPAGRDLVNMLHYASPLQHLGAHLLLFCLFLLTRA